MFVSFPIPGHVNPTINFCRELGDLNVKVYYYTLEKLFSKFDGIKNIELCNYPKEFAEYYDLKNEEYSQNPVKKYRPFSLLNLFYSFAEILTPYMIEEVEKIKPDLIICDPFSIWGKAVSRYFNIPWINFFCAPVGDFLSLKECPSFIRGILKSLVLDYDQIHNIKKTKRRIAKKYGINTEKLKDILTPQGKYSIVMTSKEFHPNGDKYPSNIKFVGPAHVENCIIPDDKDTIFISIGTILQSDTFWDTCISAIKDLGYKVVISFGNVEMNKINTKDLHENVIIHKNLSLDEFRCVLKKSVLFISHGGFNSITDSILYKTPLLVCPTTPEQATNGEMIEAYGCGMLYPYKKIEEIKLREKALEIINNPNRRSGLEKYRQSFLDSLGCKKAAEDLVKEFNLS